MKGLDIPFLNSDHPDVISITHPLPTDMSYDIRKSVILYLKSL